MTSAVLFAAARLGYVVNIRQDGGRYVATAYREGETFVARAPDAYTAAVELAGQVGVEADDGSRPPQHVGCPYLHHRRTTCPAGPETD